MVIRYRRAPELDAFVLDIVRRLGMTHLDTGRIVCVRSKGSSTDRILARIHGLPRIWQFALGAGASYVIEVISESYDHLSEVEREKVLIHELLHIPTSFGGGFRHHRDWVDRQRVERMYRMLRESRSRDSRTLASGAD
jgi:predicted metallopeptidase